RRSQPQDRHEVRQEVAVATKDITVPQAGERNLTELIRVAVPERSIRADLRAVSIVWRRELIRFRTDRLRAVTSLVQPVLFLFILGTGLSRLAGRGLAWPTRSWPPRGTRSGTRCSRRTRFRPSG